jgi:hypothetical protein
MTKKPQDQQEECLETVSTQCQNLDQKMDKILDKIKHRQQSQRKKAS